MYMVDVLAGELAAQSYSCAPLLDMLDIVNIAAELVPSISKGNCTQTAATVDGIVRNIAAVL